MTRMLRLLLLTGKPCGTIRPRHSKLRRASNIRDEPDKHRTFASPRDSQRARRPFAGALGRARQASSLSTHGCAQARTLTLYGLTFFSARAQKPRTLADSSLTQ